MSESEGQSDLIGILASYYFYLKITFEYPTSWQTVGLFTLTSAPPPSTLAVHSHRCKHPPNYSFEPHHPSLAPDLARIG
ncbi:hypothetical protein N7471_010085 [Penicillium samsonianum]|uniref:uncharacterized protein n=1 Tax=Penicillium samsonianum TaxID=1882272 RepID=UPI002547293E|nr:uncharacterized protein N7471_010085 [Penicillium samsonianum]KAJ6128868.1 hypothetical protein N7471_010085 [Penicillium samsonianum]